MDVIERYGSKEMREIFSEENKRKLWRKIWVALAEAQGAGREELKILKKEAEKINITESLKVEKEIKHDLMAELKVFSKQCGEAGKKLHQGATSADVKDNAEIIMFKRAMKIIRKKLILLLKNFAKLIKKTENIECMGYTHLQPAEPTLMGYRFSFYAQDLLEDLKLMDALELKGKGIKGAVGTNALIPTKIEKKTLALLGLKTFEITTQTYPRKQDFEMIFVLSSIAQSLSKFAFDLRILQSYGEVYEVFEEKQVGSSAMPFKRNPILSERICSLSRLISSYLQVSWQNASLSALERTLDDSANRRYIPLVFLAVDECLELANKVVTKIKINKRKVKENLERYKIFYTLDALMFKLTEEGESRQKLHEKFREDSMKAWGMIEKGKTKEAEKIMEKELEKMAYPKLSEAQKKCKLIINKINRIPQ